MRIREVPRRLKLGLAVAALAAAASVVFVTGAVAQPGDLSGIPANSPVFNPQETNVPYLAWRGEMVRLVKCTGPEQPRIEANFGLNTVNGGFLGNQSGLNVSMLIFAYSGPQENSFDGPKAVDPSGNVFYDRANNRLCVRGTFISNKAGITIVKLMVSYNGIPLIAHDFLIGWMGINSVDITNPGTVEELPGEEPGNSVNVQVSGSIPLNSEFQEDYQLPPSLVLPRDYAMWANQMASTSDYLENNRDYLWASASAFWDIHDSSGPLGNESPDGSPDVHVNQGSCPASTPDVFDQVDNCDGSYNGGYGRVYSRQFGDFADESGPFDPSYGYSTLLTDGRLNSSDAPMPALKIVGNSSGGMGGFVDGDLNDKRCVYNRDSGLPGSCITPGNSLDDAHELYAPYYVAFIPATSRNPLGAASGTDGAYANNFPGYQWYGKYHYWEIAKTLSQGQGGNSGCLLRGAEERQLNTGATKVFVFTDEHGEARLQWQPGVNADFFGDLFVDENGGCDLEGVTFPNQTLTVAGRYPFQPVANDIPGTGSITKVILNQFHKEVACHRKNNTGGIVYVCTASATDITGGGQVFNGETVCFSREPTGDWYDYPGGQTPYHSSICRELGGGTSTDPATVSVETPATLQGTLLDISANFTSERLWRDACINVGQQFSTPGPCGPVGGGTTTTTTTTTTGGTSTGGTTTSGTTTSGTTTSGTTTGATAGNQAATSHGPVSKTKTSKAAKVVSVRIVLNQHGRVLMVKVRSAKKTAKIQIRLLNQKGKVIKRVVRVVQTNKLVAVKNLRLSKQVFKVRVVVLR
jgi:hypothetical protein